MMLELFGFTISDLSIYTSFVISLYIIILCYLFREFNYSFHDLSLLYFAPLDNLLLVQFYLLLLYYPENLLLLFFCVATPAFVSVLFRHFCRIFFLCPQGKPPVSFTPFSFPSLTLLSLSSPLLHHFFPKLTSLFWLSITKSNAFALLSSSDSSVNSCPSILSSSSCSIFNLLNTFYSF